MIYGNIIHIFIIIIIGIRAFVNFAHIFNLSINILIRFHEQKELNCMGKKIQI